MTQNERIDIYDSFELSSDCTSEEINSKYKALLLKTHPDKNQHKTAEEREKLTQEFLLVTSYYKILKDPLKRKQYDLSGEIEELKENSLDWKDYFNEMYKITEIDIEQFKVQYRYSEEERKDVLDKYCSTKGDLLKMIEFVKLSEYSDIDRFTKIIEAAIEAGQVSKYKKFPKVNKKQLANKMKELKAEEKEAEIAREESENGNDSLKQILAGKNEERLKALIKRLEGKTANDNTDDMPDEAAFLATRDKMEKRKVDEAAFLDKCKEGEEPVKKAKTKKAKK
jgi:curved DNA-binding protein CbpA